MAVRDSSSCSDPTGAVEGAAQCGGKRWVVSMQSATHDASHASRGHQDRCYTLLGSADAFELTGRTWRRVPIMVTALTRAGGKLLWRAPLGCCRPASAGCRCRRCCAPVWHQHISPLPTQDSSAPDGAAACRPRERPPSPGARSHTHRWRQSGLPGWSQAVQCRGSRVRLPPHLGDAIQLAGGS